MKSLVTELVATRQEKKATKLADDFNSDKSYDPGMVTRPASAGFLFAPSRTRTREGVATAHGKNVANLVAPLLTGSNRFGSNTSSTRHQGQPQ